MSLRIFAVSAIVGAMVACGLTNGEAHYKSSHALCFAGELGQAINSTGPVPAGCQKIEGSEIGDAPQTITLSNGTVITITSWVQKGDSSGDYVGFTFTSTAPVAFAVKASTRTFVSNGNSWVHPDGTSGPQANGISNITFCPDPGSDGGTPIGTPDGGGSTDGGGGGGGECTPGDGGSGGGGGGNGDPCATDSDCSNELSCQNMICQPKPDGGSGGGGNGDPCASDGDCSNEFSCQMNICTPRPDGGSSGGQAGSPCAVTTDCVSGLTCVNNSCTLVPVDAGTPGGAGSPCQSNTDCASGHACQNNVCTVIVN